MRLRPVPLPGPLPGRLSGPLSLVLLSVVSATVLADGPALEVRAAQAEPRLVVQQPREDRQIELNIHGSAYYGYGWYDSFDHRGYYGDIAAGIGVQMLFPIVKNAIPSLNNPMYLGFFTDILFHPFPGDTVISLAIGPVFQWRFVLLDILDGGSLSAFANIGFGLWPWFYPNNGGVGFYGFPLFELGANVFFTRHVGLTLSLGYPSVKLGLSLAF